jgi:hypothetical protein
MGSPDRFNLNSVYDLGTCGPMASGDIARLSQSDVTILPHGGTAAVESQNSTTSLAREWLKFSKVIPKTHYPSWQNGSLKSCPGFLASVLNYF